MLNVVMTVGIPGCGKTTFAKEWLAKSPATRARANRDDIRAMIAAPNQHNGSGADDFEKLVTMIQFKTIWEELKAARNIIVDNTHLQPKYFMQMREFLQDFANQFNQPVTLSVEVLDVDYDVCLARNNARDRVVPEHVVSRMYDSFVKIKKYVKENYSSPVIIHPSVFENKNINNLPSAIICDIDGTIGDLSHRDPYDFAKCVDDGVHTDIVEILHTMAETYDAKIVIISGRDDSCMEDTKLWLDANDIRHDFLFMRKTGDSRSDRYVKEDIYNKLVKDNYFVHFVLDDRDQVVRTWRNLGIRCLQVAYGEF